MEISLSNLGSAILSETFQEENNVVANIGDKELVKKVIDLVALYGLDAHLTEDGKISVTWHFPDMAIACAAKLMELELIGLELTLEELYNSKSS